MDQVDPLQKLLSAKCPLHPEESRDLLLIADNPADLRICCKCLSLDNIPQNSVLELKALFKAASNNDCILTNYPPLDDSTIHERLLRIQSFSDDQMTKRIEKQISDLKQTFDLILEKLKKKSLKSVVELAKQKIQVLDYYESICERNQLQDAVMGASETNEEIRLREVIQKKRQDSAINTNQLQDIIQKFEASQQKFSTEWVEQSSQNLQDAMQNISFFSSSITPLFYPYSILQDFWLVASNHVSSASRTLISRNHDNQLDMKCLKGNGSVCTALSQDALNNNTYYTFRFTFHREAAGGVPQFNIGLINETYRQRETQSVNVLRYRQHDQVCEINKVVKGAALNSALNATNDHWKMEMRVHISSRTLKIADFPNYNNVMEPSNKTDIKACCKYYLLAEIGHVNNHITLTEVIVSKGFDDLM